MAIKTLHITNSYHPASGGIRTFYHAMLEAANRHRRFVRLVVPGPETSVEEVGEFGRIYHVAAPHVPVLDSRYRWMLPHVYAWPYDSPLRKILAAERPDLVEVCDKFWLLAASWDAALEMTYSAYRFCGEAPSAARTAGSASVLARPQMPAA